MADNRLHVDAQLMDDMTATFNRGAEQLQDTMTEMKAIAETLSGGEALLGRGGDAFHEAILNKLCPAVERLEDKFKELAVDVQVAKDEVLEADQEVEQKFR